MCHCKHTSSHRTPTIYFIVLYIYITKNISDNVGMYKNHSCCHTIIVASCQTHCVFEPNPSRIKSSVCLSSLVSTPLYSCRAGRCCSWYDSSSGSVNGTVQFGTIHSGGVNSLQVCVFTGEFIAWWGGKTPSASCQSHHRCLYGATSLWLLTQTQGDKPGKVFQGALNQLLKKSGTVPI